jgi:hypothetical protein
MRKLWMGVVAAAVLVVAVLVLYFKMSHVDRSYYDAIPTGQTAPNITTTSPLSQTVGVVKPPFNASAYEVNYTIVFAVSTGGITVTIDGWMVIGVGPFGNYSFGVLTVPLRGTAAYKTATMENGTTYTLACAAGDCTVIEEEEWPFSRLIDGVNVTRTAKGQCKHLNYTGMLYEERGALDPKAMRRLIQEMTGNYTAYICEVNGVALSADLTSTAVVYDTPVRVMLKLEAVDAGPYRPDTYHQILQEIKANE